MKQKAITVLLITIMAISAVSVASVTMTKADAAVKTQTTLVASRTTAYTGQPVIFTAKLFASNKALHSKMYAGPFVGSKKSNVYHLPICPEAKKILPKNLVRFPNAQAARTAGYRPCKVCHPPS